MNRFGQVAVLGVAIALSGYGQAINYTSLDSNLGNLAILAGNPAALLRYSNTGLLINTIAPVPNAIAVTKVLGNFLVTTGSTLLQVTPVGAVTTLLSAPSVSGTAAQWVSLAPDGLGNVVLADNRLHAVWQVNLQTNTPKLVASYPVSSASENEDVGITVDPSGSYLVLDDNGTGVSMFAITPTGTVTPVTLTGAAAKNTNGRLIRYNGGYAFVSFGDNAIFTIAFTTPPGSSSPPVATVTELAGNVAAAGTAVGLSANLDSGYLHIATSAGTLAEIDLKTNGNGVCAPNCSVDTIAFPSQPHDVIEETWGGLPYVAYGNVWTTGVYVVNTGDTPASYDIHFYNPDGSAAIVPFTGSTSTSLNGTLPAHGMAYVEASNAAASTFSTASGLISADPTVSVQALFRDASNGIFYEASVPSALGANEFTMPFDFTTFAPTSQQLFTGIAISNMSPTGSSTVTCNAVNQSGTSIPNAVTVPQIAPLGQFSGFAFTPLYGLRGTLKCSANTRITGLGVRSLGSTFSTLPVLY